MDESKGPREAMRFTAARDERSARLVVRAGERVGDRIGPFVTGEFCEHLGSNIYNGMCAQILRNPTFSPHPFASGRSLPDGGVAFESDPARLRADAERLAARTGWPAECLEPFSAAPEHGLALFWIPEGGGGSVRCSPDISPEGRRAQRVRILAGGAGIAQWTSLPAHRVRRFTYELLVRSGELDALRIRVWTAEGEPAASASVRGMSERWRELRGELELSPGLDAVGMFRVSLVAEEPGQFVVAALLLWPADHLRGADPDVVRLLRDSRLPMLRWPGGNFASGYRWEDGIGPRLARPTLPNRAWGGTEPNVFGTDEFIAFCRDVGCEPLICVNAGSATPEEAARWVRYCNAGADSIQGRRRAANGHPEPHGVRFWEVGNELYGRWQEGWTTPEGYVDRYRRFAEAMAEADPSIRLLACGSPVLTGDAWNEALVRGGGRLFTELSDHVLLGSGVPPDADPLDVYRDFLALPAALEGKYREMRELMLRAGIERPRIAITELQLFARIRGEVSDPGRSRLTPETLVSPATLAEALYDTLLYHVAARLAPLIEIITHSATVNHGGGLRKERERVYANPCYYARSLFSAFLGASPVLQELECGVCRAPGVLTDLRESGFQEAQPRVDSLAAVDGSGDLVVSLVHRGTDAPVELEVEVAGMGASSRVDVAVLSSSRPWDTNSLEQPERISPARTTARLRSGKLRVELSPFSLLHLRVRAASGLTQARFGHRFS